MAREFDLATQEWIDIPDKPVDLDKLRENILRLWADALGDNDLPQSTRIRVARDAAPYLFAKYQAVAQVNGQDLGEKLAQAIAATGKVIDGRPAQVLPPPNPASVEPVQVDEPDHSKSFAHDNKSRWRRF